MSTYNPPHLTEICSNGPSISAYGRLLTFDEALYELSSEDQDRLRPYTTGAPGTIGGKLLQIVEAVNNQIKVLSWRKSVGLRAAAYRIMEWTRVIDPVGQAATSAFPLYAAFPWAAFRILAERTRVSEELLISICQDMEKAKRYLLSYTQQSQALTYGEIVQAINDLHRTILRYLSQVILICDANPARRIYHSIFLPRILKRTAGEIDRLLHDIECQIQSNHEKEQRRHEEVNRIFQSICNPRYEEGFQWLKDQRFKCTGHWIFKHQQFQNWVTTKKGLVLWIYGILGAGKSVLTSQIIERLQGNQDTVVYFFSGNGPARWDLRSIIQCFVAQLAVIDQKNIPRKLLEAFRRSQETGGRVELFSVDTWEQFLAEMLLKQPKPFLVIDGLDAFNLTLQSDLLGLITKLRNKCNQLRVLVSSRESQNIRSRLKDKLCIDLSTLDRSDEERAVIQAKFDSVNTISDKDRAFFIDKIMQKSHGQILFACLLADSILECDYHFERLNCVSRLPEGLTELYNEVMRKINDNSRTCKYAHRAFKFMMASPVRVSSQLIIAAVFQDEDNGKIQLLPKDVTNEYIIKACSCFLLYDQRTDAFDFSHRSAWKYLKTQFSAETCNLYLARLSLKILSKTQKCDKAIAQKPPFDCIRPIVIHSAGFWFLYVRSLGNKAADDSQLQDLLREFLQPRGTQSGYGWWYKKCHQFGTEIMQELDMHHRYAFSDVLSSPPSPWFLVGAFGLSSIIETLTKQPELDVNGVNEVDETGFSLAIKHHHVRTTQALLHRRVHVRPRDFSKALQVGEDMNIVLSIWRSPHIQQQTLLSTDTLIAAARNWHYRNQTLRGLLRHWPSTVPIQVNRELVMAFSFGYHFPSKLTDSYMRRLLENNRIIVDDEALPLIAADWSSVIMKTVLERRVPKLPTKKLLKLLFSAVRNTEAAEVMVSVLLRHVQGDIPLAIWQRLLTRAAKNARCGQSLVDFFLKDNRKIRVTEKDLIVASANEEPDQALRIFNSLLKHSNRDKVTGALLQQVVKNLKYWSEREREELAQTIWKSKGFEYSKCADLAWEMALESRNAIRLTPCNKEAMPVAMKIGKRRGRQTTSRTRWTAEASRLAN